MALVQILMIFFLVLWILIGVGAIFVILRFNWVIKKLERMISNILETFSDLSGAFRSVSSNKEAIIGGLTLLAMLKRFFSSESRTKK